METETKAEPDATEPVDRVAEIAKEEVAKMEKAAETEADKAKTTEPVKGESTDAPTESSPEKKVEKPIEKTEEKKEPTEADKVRHSMQKRIDELTKEKNEEKEKREADSKKVSGMETELADLKKSLKDSKALPTEAEAVEAKQEALIKAYTKEDADLDRLKKREMSDSDLEEWLLEDYSKATQWIIKRDMRREKEAQVKPKPEPEPENLDKIHSEARIKLTTKYPGTVMKERAVELKKSGKTNAEITETLKSENSEFKMMMEIIDSDVDKYTKVANGPELVMLEMDKRVNSETKKTYTAEEVEQIKKETAMNEQKRLAGVDNGFSDTGSNAVGDGNETLPAGYSDKGLQVFIKSGAGDREQYLKVLKRRNNIPGVNEL